MPGEIEAVEPAGHLDIGEHRLDARALIEDSQRLVDIGRAKHCETRPVRGRR